MRLVSVKEEAARNPGSRAQHSQDRRQEAAAGAITPDVDLGRRRKEGGEGAKMERKVAVAAMVPEQGTPAPPPTGPDPPRPRVQGSPRREEGGGGRTKSDTEGWRWTTKNANHQKQ
jgi:hypothetical protein